MAGNAELGRETVSQPGQAPSSSASAHRLRWLRNFARCAAAWNGEVPVPATNTKTAAGGYYDIDFAVSLLRLRGQVTVPPGANMEEQLAALSSAGLANEGDLSVLSKGANFLRSVDHAVRLVTGRSADGLPDRAGYAEAVENLARRWGLITGAETLSQRLDQTRRQVRDVHRRVVETN